MDAAGPRLSVVLVDYATLPLTLDCLSSLRRQLGPDGVEVIVVDNASPGFDPAAVRDVWPEASIVESSVNLGFGRGNNLGAAEASAPYLWLLNTDTLIPDDHRIPELLDWLDTHPAYAAASPLLTDAAGRVQPWQAGHFPALWRMAISPAARAVGARVPSLRGSLAAVDATLAPREAADVDQAVAAALVIRRAAFEQVGGFSPEYFFFLEDTDLCRKLAERGWRLRWMPGSHVVHLWGRSLRHPAARQRMFFDAQDRYFRRWHAPWQLAVLRVMRVPLRLAARARQGPVSAG